MFCAVMKSSLGEGKSMRIPAVTLVSQDAARYQLFFPISIAVAVGTSCQPGRTPSLPQTPRVL